MNIVSEHDPILNMALVSSLLMELIESEVDPLVRGLKDHMALKHVFGPYT